MKKFNYETILKSSFNDFRKIFEMKIRLFEEAAHTTKKIIGVERAPII